MFDEAEKNEIEKAVKMLDDEAAAKEELRKASDARNQKWLEEQHKIKEQEYAKLFDEAEKNEVDKAIKMLDDEAAAKEELSKASDERNQKWLEEQHKIKEQEYARLFDEAEKAKATDISEEPAARVINNPDYTDFNNEMLDFLRNKGLMPFRPKNIKAGEMPPAYNLTDSHINNAVLKFKSFINKIKIAPHLKARKESIIRHRILKGCWNRETALKSRLMITPKQINKKMHETRYNEMASWTDEEWNAAKMSREEFMKNRSQYILEDLYLD